VEVDDRFAREAANSSSAAALAGGSLEGVRAQGTVKQSDRSALSWPSLNDRCAGPDLLLYAWPGYRRLSFVGFEAMAWRCRYDVGERTRWKRHTVVAEEPACSTYLGTAVRAEPSAPWSDASLTDSPATPRNFSKPYHWGVDCDLRRRPGAHVSIRPPGLSFRV